MKPLLAVLILAGSLVASGCGRGTEQATPSMPMPAPAVTTPASTGDVQVTFKSEPNPPKAGDNTFDVVVMSGGQPVTDADVSVEFFMPAMPSMKMPEMRNTVTLKHEGGGRYRGTGNVMMAGSWDATVSVKRGGQVVGTHKVPITAK